MLRRPIRRHAASARAPLCAGALATLAACGALTPDATELETIFPSYVVPKSSPRQLVSTFDEVCSRAPAAQPDRARDIGYVPGEPARRGAVARLYVIDTTRPGLRLGPRLCVAEAIARTGQTRAAETYVARLHPEARSLPPQGDGVERLWRLPDGTLLATRRWRDAENLPRYALIRYREDAA